MNSTAFALLATLALAGGTLAALTPLPACAHEGEHFSAGVPGDPKKPARTIEVTMKEEYGTMEFVPNRIEVKRNEQIRFILKNIGAEPHEFVLATTKENLKHAALMRKYPDMEHDDPNAKTLQPKTQAEILWRFTKKGEFEFSCLIPGHRESGMLGHVIVK